MYCAGGCGVQTSSQTGGDRKKGPGVTYTKKGKYESYIHARIMTPSAPQKVQTLILRTCGEKRTYEEAARCRDAAFLFISGGRCRDRHLSGLSYDNWEIASHTKGVRQFQSEMKEYNAAENIFLLADGYLERMNRKIAHERVVEPYERIRFGTAESDLSERLDAPIRCEEWAKSVHVRRQNILLSAPAGCGKTHVIQHFLREPLEKEYGKKGVWVTASTGLAASALGGVTIHSAAGMQLGNKRAQDLADEM